MKSGIVNIIQNLNSVVFSLPGGNEAHLFQDYSVAKEENGSILEYPRKDT